MSRPAAAPSSISDRPAWRLSAHFFRALFDFGVLSAAGADSLKHMFAGAIGGFVASAWLMVIIYVSKYLGLWFQPSPEPYRRALLGDDMFMLGAAMLVGALVTLLVSSSLFPDERDFRILGVLPVKRSVIFGAKLTALAMFVGGFIVLTLGALLPLFLLTTRNPWGEHVFAARLLAWLVSSAAAAAFAILTVTAAAGLLGLMHSSARLQAIATSAKSAALGALVVSVPFVVRLSDMGGAMASGQTWLLFVPPAWFVGLERVLTGAPEPWFATLATVAVAALVSVALVVAAIYAVLFRDFERLVLRPPVSTPARAAAGSRRLSKAPASYLAVRLFAGATLRRGALQQGLLVGLTACGFAVAAHGLTGNGWPGAAMWTPFAMMFACGLGVRASLALPIEHRANWIFRVTEDHDARADQLRAVNDIATIWVVVAPMAASLPVLWAAIGARAVIGAAVVGVVGLLFVHVVLLDWRRIPFTCSYLPGKRFIAQSLFVSAGAYAVFVLTGQWILQTAISSTVAAIALISLGSALAYWLRGRRLDAWTKRPLMFEDEFPDALMALHLWQ